MKLVVGLGNPGPRYAETRHNVGFRIVEHLAARHDIALGARKFEARFGRGRIADHDVALLLPETWMNRSGRSLAAALRMLPLDDPSRDLLVAVDDLDLPFARLRLRAAGGAGGHRGLEDLIDHLGGGAFARLRFGIGRPPPELDPVDYVLRPFDASERAELGAALERAADAAEAVLRDGVELAMNRVNSVPSPDPEPPDDSG